MTENEINGKIENVKNNTVVHIVEKQLARKVEFYYFGEAEIMKKCHRLTRAVVVSPKSEIYYIEKHKFFFNLGSRKVMKILKSSAKILD